jgi:nucleotide-binding universal stress UspA family protein
MSKIKKILIPIDFTSASENALRYASSFLKDDRTTELVLLHVFEGEPTEEEKVELEAGFHQLAKRVLSTTQSPYSFIARKGPLLETIINVLTEVGADLIMIGTKGADPDLEDASSNTADIVLDTNVPVLVIPEKATFGIRHIALLLDKNEIDDFFVLGTLHTIARKFDAKVHVLTIHTDKGQQESHSKNESTLEYYLETLDYHCAFPENTDIERGISEYVQENQIDMVVILPRNHATKSTPSEGRLTKLLTLHTKVPLLTLD